MAKNLKGINKTSENLKNKRLEISMEDLFHIAHTNSLMLIKIDKDIQFLVKQREKRHTDYMAEVDKNRYEV